MSSWRFKLVARLSFQRILLAAKISGAPGFVMRLKTEAHGALRRAALGAPVFMYLSCAPRGAVSDHFDGLG